MSDFDKLLTEHGFANRFHQFQNLMRFRIREILLVSSLYDSFILEEDGRLSEMILSEYLDLNLSNAPGITRVSTGAEALTIAAEEGRFGLIITTMNLGDMDAVEFARRVKKAGLDIPVIMLTYDNRELIELTAYHDVSVFEKIFVWQGDFRILIAMVKYIEDKRNVDHDTNAVGVQSIIVIEDNINYYSSFLPLIYTELFKHSQSLMAESVNLSHKLLRMRARPKILLSATYEEAWQYYEKYQDCVLGVISDIEFPFRGNPDPEAGIRLAREVRAAHFDIPILLQSDSPQFEGRAREIGAGFLWKRSPVLLQQLRQFMIENFSFGDFVFRLSDGRAVGYAENLRALEEQLAVVPEESIQYHAERNHFSNWLKARTEFWLAHQLRPRKVTDFPTVEDLRQDLIKALRDFRRERHTGTVMDFDPDTFDPNASFARIGSGSLGGKARGLAFVTTLLKNFKLHERFPRTRIDVPPAVIVATDIFDQFLDHNHLRDWAINAANDSEINDRFLAAHLPEVVTADLAAYIDMVDYPLAVRSSSLLEDSKYQPFAGIYQTYMLPNNHEDPAVRLQELVSAIKRVYASTFSSRTKAYIAATPYRLEEEKMAVIIQKLVGVRHASRFYPDFAGVVRSYNFYPHPPMIPSDGIASVALGLGTTVVDGGFTIRFCPKFPRHLLQFSGTEDTLRYSQREFWALDLGRYAGNSDHTREIKLTSYGLEYAEQDGTLPLVASTYSRENDAITDGLSRPGVRLVTFAPILKNELFPLAEILDLIMEMGRWGLSSPVEIEFAVNHSVPRGTPREFAFLQMRPLVTSRELEELDVENVEPERLLCQSPQVLGNGLVAEIYDLVVVDPDGFRRDKSMDVAREVSQFNADLVLRRRPYALIGVGRWGSSDPWLGIPVTWDQISGVRAIVESSFKDFNVAPSQGSHFFQNITSARIGYFSVNAFSQEGFVDWGWLRRQRPVTNKQFVRHYRFDHPVVIKMNGRTNRGIILKPF
ncbi:MAG: PEP/pyruvate-binding domain-containing protein [Candidatus Zixiibacteriota bacterium]